MIKKSILIKILLEINQILKNKQENYPNNYFNNNNNIINETRRNIENKGKQINLLIQSMRDENELLAAKSKIFFK